MSGHTTITQLATSKCSLLMNFPKDLLDIESLSLEQIQHLLSQAKQYAQSHDPAEFINELASAQVLSLFYENSTRTLSSFEVAAKRLGASVTHFDVGASSVKKGESTKETIQTLEAMGVDYMIVRHSASSFTQQLGKQTHAHVINAGDGMHAHPTQALLDAFTIQQEVGDISGQRILITGDILHSRVARSTSNILLKLGAQVGFLAPQTLQANREAYADKNVTFFDNFETAMQWQPSIIYLLRVQSERQGKQNFPSTKEYHNLYGVTEARLQEIRDKGLYIMHPGPVNRGVELCDGVLDYEKSLIAKQVKNGIYTRMAVLSCFK